MSAASLFKPEIIQQIPSAIYVCDATAKIIQYNQRAIEIWKETPQQGECESDFYSRFRLLDFDGATIFTAPLTRVLIHDEQRKNWDLVLEKKDGSRVAVLFNAVPMRDSSGGVTGAIAVFQEISDLKRAEEAVRVAQRLAATSRVASNMAQQITDPIATIARSVAELEQDNTLSQTARHYAAVVQQESRRLGTIARQALALYGVRP